MNQASNGSHLFQAPVATAAATVFSPSLCWAAGQTLPWDSTLNAVQSFVAGPLAQSVIVISAVLAILGFTLVGDSELSRRLVKAVIGTGAALLAVRLLNYLAP